MHRRDGARIFNNDVIDIRTHLRVDEILAGGCVAIAFGKSRQRRRCDSYHLAVAVAFWITASLWFTGPLQFLRPYSSALLLWVTLQLKGGPLLKVLESSTARYIATISYALYVIYPITAHGWMNEGSTFERYALKRPISFALTFLLAHLSTFYYELRWTERAKRFLNVFHRRLLLKIEFSPDFAALSSPLTNRPALAKLR